MVPPVFPASKVEHDGFAQLLVLHQKSEGRLTHISESALPVEGKKLGSMKQDLRVVAGFCSQTMSCGSRIGTR